MKMRKIIQNTVFGIGLGNFLFTIACIIFEIIGEGHFKLENWSYIKMAVASMAVGVGFSVPTIVYENEKLVFGMQALIHMSIGCIIYLIAAFLVGWIPLGAGWLVCALTILGQLGSAFFIWIGFVVYYKQLAKRMNAKIQEKQKS